MRNIPDRLMRRQPVLLSILLTLLLFTLSACAPNSGIFSGGSWQKGGLQEQHLQVLAVDPNHPRNIYAGDAHNGVFASIDAGKTWKQSSLPLPAAVAALSFDTPGKKLYAATSAGLFVSADAATTWSAVAGLPADSYTALAFDFNSPHTVYVGSSHSGVLTSSDDGAHWTRISNGLPTNALTSLLYDPNLKQLWAAFTDTLYRSDDNGAHWHAMSNGISPSAGINVLALGGFSANNTGLLFAGTEHGFYRSSDAGQHWAQSQEALNGLHIAAVLPDATQANVVYISTSIGVLRSQDSGQNWSQLSAGLPTNQSLNGLAQGDDNNAQLFVASRGIYLFPGSGGVFNPAQLIPILLVLSGFGMMYWFFVLRRQRRSTARQAAPPGATNGQNKQKEEE